MSEDKIQVDEIAPRPGERVATAFVGPQPNLLTLFEIRKVEGSGRKKERYDYYVDRLQVTREAYFDAMQTCAADQYCGCAEIEDDGQEEALS